MSARFYSITVLATVAAVFAASVALAAHLFFHTSITVGQRLRQYQMTRAENMTHVPDVLFIGDSSLGNAVSEKLFARATGHSTVNLALSGFEGFAGAYALLTRVLEKGNPRVVVLMMSFATMSYPIRYDAYLYMARGWQDIARLGIKDRLQLFDAMMGSLVPLFKTRYISPPRIPSPLFVDGYVVQNPTHKPKVSDINVQFFRVNPKKPLFLHFIADECRKRSIPLIYVTGPVWERVTALKRNMAYWAQAKKILSSVKDMKFVDTLVEVPDSEIGDTQFHVAPQFKKKYTIQYADILKSHIDQAIGRAAP